MAQDISPGFTVASPRCYGSAAVFPGPPTFSHVFVLIQSGRVRDNEPFVMSSLDRKGRSPLIARGKEMVKDEIFLGIELGSNSLSFSAEKLISVNPIQALDQTNQ